MRRRRLQRGAVEVMEQPRNLQPEDRLQRGSLAGSIRPDYPKTCAIRDEKLTPETAWTRP